MASSVQLEISGAGVERESVQLSPGVTIIGRGPGSTILLNHPQVSRKHAEIRLDGAVPEISDQGSANGTRVNNLELPVKEWQPLHAGDRVDVGPFSLLVQDGGGAGSIDSAATQVVG